MYHFNTKTAKSVYNYDWNQVKVVKLPNGLYCGTIFVKDLEYPCWISAWTQHRWITQYKDFINNHGGLDMKKKDINKLK
jgi:hypothetical protein